METDTKDYGQLLESILKRTVDEGASDLFLIAGGPISCKVDGVIHHLSEDKLFPENTKGLVGAVYTLAERDTRKYEADGDDDFSFAIAGLARFRVNAFRQRGSLAAVVRVVQFEIPDYHDLQIPEEIMAIAKKQHGMVIVCGTAGSGKSTTQACIIDKINRERSAHIVTLEDPIEYLHSNNRSLISQREIAIDTQDYLSALRACLRQAPDVILLGEMRDYETIRTAMTAAETGHLLLATLHTRGAVNTIDRIIDSFPSQQQEQIRTQLAAVLITVVSQQLVPGVGGKMIPVFEIMHVNPAIRNMIRDNKSYQIENAIQTSGSEGMISMDQYLVSLFRKGQITAETAMEYAMNPEQLERKIQM